MEKQIIDIIVNGVSIKSYIYKTVVLKNNSDFASQITDPNCKYVIKWNYDLNGGTVTIPENCILYFDGGSINNGTLIGNNTIIEGEKRGNAIYSGTFIDKTLDTLKEDVDQLKSAVGTGGSIDERIAAATEDVLRKSKQDLSNSEKDVVLNNILGKESGDGKGIVILLENVVNNVNTLVQDMFYKGPENNRVPNTDTIFVIKYDYDLNGSTVYIPNGCTLKFVGGSISNGTLVGSDTVIDADPVQIFGTDVEFSGTWIFVEAYAEWFGAKGDGVTNDEVAVKKVLDVFRGKTIHFLKDRKYLARKTPVFSYTTIIIDGTLTSNTDADPDQGFSLEFFDRIHETPAYTGTHDVVICGTGTIDEGGLRVKAQNTPLRIHHCKNILIKDITIKGAFMWHSIECGGTDGLTLDNVTVYSTDYDNSHPQTFRDKCGNSIQIEDSDSGSTSGAFPYDNTPTKNVTIRDCKFLVSPDSPFQFDYVGGNHPDDEADPDGDAVHDIVIENCYFEGSKQHQVSGVIFYNSAYNIEVRGCKFDNIYQGRGCCFGVHVNPDRLKVKNCKVIDCEFVNCQYGVALQREEGASIENCLFRSTEVMDGNPTIEGEYTMLGNEVNKRFNSVWIINGENVHVTNNTFTNVTLGVSGYTASADLNLYNKDLYVTDNRFDTLAAAAVYLTEMDGDFTVSRNVINKPLLFPTMSWNWDATSAVCIGCRSRSSKVNSLKYTIVGNKIELDNPDCGNIFYKQPELKFAQECFEDNIIKGLGLLSPTALAIYNDGVDANATNFTPHRATGSSGNVSVFEDVVEWLEVGTYDSYATSTIEEFLDYTFVDTLDLLEIGREYKVEVENIPDAQRVIYRSGDDYPSWYFEDDEVTFTCLFEQDGRLVVRSENQTPVNNAVLKLYVRKAQSELDALNDKIQAEAGRAEGVEEGILGRVESLESKVGPLDIRMLVIGDSYSDSRSTWIPPLMEKFSSVSSYISLAVGAATVRDNYTDRTQYPYTSRPIASDSTGNRNTFACQIEKLDRLMAGVDLDEGETAIYQTPESYPNIIVIEGGMNDSEDNDNVQDTYFSQFQKRLDNVYAKSKVTGNVSLATWYTLTPADEVNRTCFGGAYRYLIESLQTRFPNAQIFITTASMLGYWTSDVVGTRMKIAEQQRICANYASVNVIDWNKDGQISIINNHDVGSGTLEDPYLSQVPSGLDTDDTMHPNSRGGKKLASVAYHAIISHFMDINSF